MSLTRSFDFNNYKLFNDFTIDYSTDMTSNLNHVYTCNGYNGCDNQTEINTKALLDFRTMPGELKTFSEAFVFKYIPKYLGLNDWLSPQFTYSPNYSWNLNVSSIELPSANFTAQNTFNVSVSLDIKSFIEKFYTASSSTSSYGGYQSSSNNSSSKTFEAKNVYVKSLLKFMHLLSKKLSGFSISYTEILRNQFNNIQGDYRPKYDFKLGIISSPLDDISIIEADNSQILSFENNIDKDFTISTALSISPKITFTSLTYTKSKDENYPNNALSVISTSESYYAIGYDGKSGIPIFNWSLNINNLNDFWILDDWFNNIMLQHSFSGNKEETYNDDILKTTIFTKNFSPYAGFTFNFKRPQGMQISLFNNKTLSITNSISTTNEPRVDRVISNILTFSLDWSKTRQKDLKFFKSNIQIENAFTFNFDVTIDDTHSDYVIITDPNQEIEWQNSAFSKSFTVTPGFTYSFSEWIDCTFYISHNILETNTTNKKDESSVGFNLLIYFESQSTD